MVQQFYFFLNHVLHKTGRMPKKYYKRTPSKPLYIYPMQVAQHFLFETVFAAQQFCLYLEFEKNLNSLILQKNPGLR
jgi:hypothetical protein